MEEVYKFLERIGNSDTPTHVNVSELKEKEEEHARIINQARLGHLLRRATVERCKGQSSTTDSSCGRIERIDCDPVTMSGDVYKNWPLQKHDECWVERIRNVVLRFGQGKKQHSGTGTIEAHVNGFTYSDHGDCDEVFMHRNVESYFYQLGNRRKPPLMQFHLKHPIKIRNTETKDIQFLLVPTPLGKVTSDKDSDNIRKTRFNIRKPRFSSSSRNKDLKCRNKELKKFVHKVEETQFAVKTGLPFICVKFQALDEFQFDAAVLPTGAPTICALTRNNLVLLKEAPYLVVCLWHIQIVNLACFGDRIEMTVVFKDFERDVLQLGSIPLEFLAGIKDRLNRKNVKYYVNNLRPNWSETVREIRECPEKFLAKGGWDIFEDSLTLTYYPSVDSYSDLDSGSAKTTLGEIPDEEIPDEEIPNEFLDPIVYTLMKDPVILPSSRITVDRPVIQRHLLGVNWDPFNHSHLTQDMLIPDVELKARIEEFIKPQGLKKHSCEGKARIEEFMKSHGFKKHSSEGKTTAAGTSKPKEMY